MKARRQLCPNPTLTPNPSPSGSGDKRAERMEYQVELPTFRGPLDLLLFLVKQHEVDLQDIPIALIAEQFLAYLNLLQVIDVEAAGEFLVMAATLMEIKSKMLLPRAETETHEEEDPRLELVKQLIEYKKYKEAAELLEEHAERQLARLPRMPLELPAPPDLAHQPLRKVELWDLVSAFGRLMRETAALQPSHIAIDETPIQTHMDRIVEILKKHERVSLSELFAPPRTRGRLLGLFLATLELIKGCTVWADQPEAFGELWLRLAQPVTEETAAPETANGPQA
ncbi:MAG: segregation/condensation protein A [Planctomycetes bacterium]|nr:segregation/condensation protein A [Planctomycetota bacterium]